jgi:CHASE2 domain-containing sensor protein
MQDWPALFAALMMIAVFALVGMGLARLRTDRKRALLMIVAGLVLLGNVLIIAA